MLTTKVSLYETYKLNFRGERVFACKGISVSSGGAIHLLLLSNVPEVLQTNQIKSPSTTCNSAQLCKGRYNNNFGYCLIVLKG